MHFIPVTSLEPAIFHHTAWLHHHFLIRSVYRAIAPTGISSGDSSAETQPFRSRVYPDDNEKAPTAAREIAIAISTSSQLTHHQRRAARGGLKASSRNQYSTNSLRTFLHLRIFVSLNKNLTHTQTFRSKLPDLIA